MCILKSSCPPSQVNAQIWIENEQSMVKRQIEESNGDETLQIRSRESWWIKESSETKIKQFGHKIKEKSLFQNQQKSDF